GYNYPAAVEMTGGQLSVGENEYIYSGIYPGIIGFTQSGGTHSVSGLLYLGDGSYGGGGGYNLNGGSLYAFSEIVGYGAWGSLAQSGGVNATPGLVNALYLGYNFNDGSNGTYNLSGNGLLSEYYEYIGYGGIGSLTQSGGTNTATWLYLANYAGSSGTYNLNGGLLTTESLIQGSGAAATFNFSGGTFQAGTGFSTTVPIVLNTAGNKVFDTNGYTLTLNGAISGPGGLQKIGAGTLILSSINSYSGGTTISGGILASTGGGNTTALGTGNVTVNAGGTLRGDVWDAFGYGVGVSPALITINGGTVTTGTSGNFYVSLPNIVFNGGGTISSGAGNGGDALWGNVTTYAQGAGAATISVTNPGATTALISAGTLGLGAATTTFDVAAGSAPSQLTVSSVMKDTYTAASLVKIGAGTLILSSINSYSGGTYVEEGELIATNNGALANGSSLIVGANASAIFGGAAVPRTTAPVTAVPEPGTLVLLSVAGIAGAAATWRRRRN
ncbi:MAG: autotransporter-associated beta strand repeat-containing protein, partial [Thermoguttaceae bacterium]